MVEMRLPSTLCVILLVCLLPGKDNINVTSTPVNNPATDHTLVRNNDVPISTKEKAANRPGTNKNLDGTSYTSANQVQDVVFDQFIVRETNYLRVKRNVTTTTGNKWIPCTPNQKRKQDCENLGICETRNTARSGRRRRHAMMKLMRKKRSKRFEVRCVCLKPWTGERCESPVGGAPADEADDTTEDGAGEGGGDEKEDGESGEAGEGGGGGQCKDNPCEFGGTCTSNTDGSHSCTCKPFFDPKTDCQECVPGRCGGDCSRECRHCHKKYPCTRGGCCKKCKKGYKKPYCVDVDCKKAPCHNEGFCEKRSRKVAARCVCPPGTTGELCETDLGRVYLINLPKCNSTDICQNGGTCYRPEGYDFQEFSCKCRKPYVGLRCESKCVESSSVCVHGVCEREEEIDTNTGNLIITAEVCKCDAGYKKSETCDKECDKGTWGQNCREKCGMCAKPPCDHESGRCDEEGCVPPYSPPFCVEKDNDYAGKAVLLVGCVLNGLFTPELLDQNSQKYRSLKASSEDYLLSSVGKMAGGKTSTKVKKVMFSEVVTVNEVDKETGESLGKYEEALLDEEDREYYDDDDDEGIGSDDEVFYSDNESPGSLSDDGFFSGGESRRIKRYMEDTNGQHAASNVGPGQPRSRAARQAGGGGGVQVDYELLFEEGDAASRDLNAELTQSLKANVGDFKSDLGFTVNAASIAVEEVAIENQDESSTSSGMFLAWAVFGIMAVAVVLVGVTILNKRKDSASAQNEKKTAGKARAKSHRGSKSRRTGDQRSRQTGEHRSRSKM